MILYLRALAAHYILRLFFIVAPREMLMVFLPHIYAARLAYIEQIKSEVKK